MSSDRLMHRPAQLHGALGLKGPGVGALDNLQGAWRRSCFQMDSVAAVAAAGEEEQRCEIVRCH